MMRRIAAVLLMCLLCAAQTYAPIPPEVKFKTRYVNPAPKPPEFALAMLWGIAIADIRVPGYQQARVEIASTRLTCRVDGKDVVLNDDSGDVRGGWYRRYPWFGTEAHDLMPLSYSADHASVILAWLSAGSRLAFLGSVAADAHSSRAAGWLHGES